MLKEKITIVLLPGLNGTEGLFQPLMERAPEIFNVLCISYPTDEIKDYAELTAMVLSRLMLIQGKFILVGESFSGPIALFVSHQKPQGLLGTILVATFISAPNLKIGRFLPWTLGFRVAKPLYALRIALNRGKNSSLLKATSTELQKVMPKVLASRIQQVFSVNANVALKACSVPLVYFRGTNDIVVPQWNLEKIVRLKPDIKVVLFETQHFLLQSKPLEAWDAIAAFANEVA